LDEGGDGEDGLGGLGGVVDGADGDFAEAEHPPDETGGAASA